MIHGEFTADQWAHLQAQFPAPPVPSMCKVSPTQTIAEPTCSSLARLGQQLFFEPALSGPPVTNTDGSWYPKGKTSCATCHDPGPPKTPRWYTDSRPRSALSDGAEGTTKHNTISIVNIAVGDRKHFTWSGQCDGRECTTMTDVVKYIALPRAMRSGPEIIAMAIRGNRVYRDALQSTDPNIDLSDDNLVYARVLLALDLYMRRLVSLDAPFDRFIRGDAAALDESETRGFTLFVGRAMCSECHRGPLLGEDSFRATGVIDAADDAGNGDGRFYTASLRNIAESAPYMHNGSMNALGEVIEFYERGGDWSGFPKDPLMHAFDIDADEARDLENFLRVLTGTPVPEFLRLDTHALGAPACKLTSGVEGLMCDGTCTNVAIDPENCGVCGQKCGPGQSCMGACYP